MDKLIVVGIDTLAGAGIAQALKDRAEVQGISFRGDVDGEGIASQFVRPGDCAGLAMVVESVEPDWLIYAGSLSAANWDLPANDPVWEHEPAMAESLLEVSRRLNAKLIALSSDAVFGGSKMFHEESEPATSTHPAADSILRFEQILTGGGALVARTHVYGWAPAGVEPGMVERVAQSLMDAAAPAVDGRRYATPILAADLAEFLLQAAERNLSGLYHLSGAERTNPFRLANELAAILGVSMPRNASVHLAPPADNAWLLETSLDSRRARRALGIPLPMLREGLQRFAREQGAGRTRHSDTEPLAQQAA
ncbi:MAG TPA: sugar nucleotide-binding protein [Pirellulales bacterium]|nr:sugar nucleotide-binding protein [Pirellulales bacterium]